MEDHQVTYALVIDIPINRETSRLYSPNRQLMMAAIEEVIHHIKRIISKEGFVTMERIFRMLELRSNPECPHILFTNVSDWNFTDDELLSIMLEHDFELLTVNIKKPVLREVKMEETTDNAGEPYVKEATQDE